MSEGLDQRQEKPYRRGLILGLTMAEIMILIIFLLLMALTAAIARRDDQIRQLSGGSETAQLVAALHRTFPQARSTQDYFKELRLAVDAERRLQQASNGQSLSEALVEDAALGAEVRQLAEHLGQTDPRALIRQAADDARAGGNGQWPPFINLSEERGYFFESGSAQLTPEFERALRTTTIDRILSIIQRYHADVIEVIGHTDEVPMSGASNLDRLLIPAIQGRAAIGSLQPTDNAGLAIARAASVTRILRSDLRLAHVTILPLSGAQLVEPVDRLADGRHVGDDRSRRRIEIRVRRSTAEMGQQAPIQTQASGAPRGR